MLICPPRHLVIRAAATTRATIITATTVAFSNSAPAAKSDGRPRFSSSVPANSFYLPPSALISFLSVKSDTALCPDSSKGAYSGKFEPCCGLVVHDS